MAATPILIRDQESLLNSPLIQITHIHPNNAHRIRSDLDQEDLIIDNFPIAIAKKLLGEAAFEPSHPQKSLKRKRSQPALKCVHSDPPTSDDVNVVVPPPATFVKASTSLRDGEVAVKPGATPKRQLLPSVELEPSVLLNTARTTTPGGNEFSPLKQSMCEPSPRSPLALLKDTNSIPTALFSPPRIPTIRGRGGRRGRGSRGGGTATVYKPRKPPPFVFYDPHPRSIDGSNPKATVVLRYELPVEGLRDVFVWAKRCVQDCRIVSLEACLLKFHDWNRVEDISEVCERMGLWQFKFICDQMLKNWREQLMRDSGRRMTIQALLS